MTAIAIDIGGTSTKLALVDSSGGLEGFVRIPTEPPLDLFIQALAEQIGLLVSGDRAVLGIGVAVAGFIDPAHSMMTYNPNIPWMEKQPLQAELHRRCHLPVRLEVDSNAAALGEYRFGSGVGAKRLLCLTVGTGIGGGLVVNGELLRFTEQCIGDVGHVIVQPGGRKCSCGGFGCAEAVAAAPAILEEAGVTTLKDVSDPVLFREAGRNIGRLAASLGAIFFPDRIVVGGGVNSASPELIAGAREEFERTAGTEVKKRARLIPTNLGARAPLIGAACSIL
jgi:glucokinase